MFGRNSFKKQKTEEQQEKDDRTATTVSRHFKHFLTSHCRQEAGQVDRTASLRLEAPMIALMNVTSKTLTTL